MIDHPEQFPDLDRPATERVKSDLLTVADRAIIDSLRKRGYEVKRLTLRYGKGWVLRGVTKARAA